MILLNGKRPRQISLMLHCQRVGCGTRVTMTGDDADPILLQVDRWGSSCPACGDDLIVARRQPEHEYRCTDR